MSRFGLALSCLLMAACSTAMYPYAEDDLEPSQGSSQTPFDASVDSGLLRDSGTRLPDSGLAFPPGFLVDGSLPPWFFDGSLPFFDASLPDGSFGRPDAGWTDFEYGCDVYDVSVSCPDRGVVQGRNCQLPAAQCPTIAGGGTVEWLRCMPATGTPFIQWQLQSTSRCGYNCAVDMPVGVNIPLATQDCRRRVITDCQQTRSGARTSQEGVDFLLDEIVAKCGIPEFPLGVTFTEEGCPATAHASLGSLIAGPQASCLQNALSTLRLSCEVPCARTAAVPFILR